MKKREFTSTQVREAQAHLIAVRIKSDTGDDEATQRNILKVLETPGPETVRTSQFLKDQLGLKL